MDDLEPQTKLARELVRRGINRNRIRFVVNNVTSDPAGPEALMAMQYIREAGFECCAQAIPRRLSYQNCQNWGKSISENDQGKLGELPVLVVSEISEALTQCRAAA
jgi:chromosome partitioning protein